MSDADEEALAQLQAGRTKVCEDCGDPWSPTDGLCSTCGGPAWTWGDECTCNPLLSDPTVTCSVHAPGGGPCGCMGGPA